MEKEYEKDWTRRCNWQAKRHANLANKLRVALLQHVEGDDLRNLLKTIEFLERTADQWATNSYCRGMSDAENPDA